MADIGLGGQGKPEGAVAEGTTSPPDWGADVRRRHPQLESVVSDHWIKAQLVLPKHQRSWFFTWIERDGGQESEEFLDDLAKAVADLEQVAGLRDRIARLAGPVPEFWAALCELKIAAVLVRGGLHVTLHRDTPDIRAHAEGGPVGIELTAGFPTLRYSDLFIALSNAWSREGRLILLVPDETDPFLTTERDALVERVQAVVYDDLPEPAIARDDRWDDGGYIYRNEGFSADERRIPTDDILDPQRLEVFLGPAPVPVTVSRSGARFGYSDPWPLITAAAEAKARKLPRSESGIVAFEGGHLHPSAHLWAGLAADGRFELELHLASHVAGVLCYWQDARRTMPTRRLFVWNDDFDRPHGPVRLVLHALGIDDAGDSSVI
ncbi:MAG: hypothetical protein H0U52_08340 [Chloroflexi bacterium]|nr:hypothetical protein [Chloroflexota bacterium]